jgi:lipoprotein NlpI
MADQLARDHPKDHNVFSLRAMANDGLGRNAEALKDLTMALELDPKQTQLLNQRGATHFKLGHIKESIADFDAYLEKHPKQAPGHWMRGISLYYAGRYEDGRKQFEGYQTTDTNDVENAVWHYLCNARAIGKDKARAAMLKIGDDKRVPMMVVYKLFKGEARPEDVLTAANAGDVKDDLRKQQRFYAHLYLGLYWDSEGDRKKALEHLNEAATTYRIRHYMADVARVHADILKK